MLQRWRAFAALVRSSSFGNRLPRGSRFLATAPFSASGGDIFRLPSTILRLNDEVKAALESETERNRVVALETAVVTHGLPYPANIDTALGMEDEIRIQGAVPATICVMDGMVHVGCGTKQLERLAKSNEPSMKVSRRDFAYALSQRLNGGTTVAGTLVVARSVGIRLFATGGIGGVHRGGEVSMDVSADLVELGRSPVAVISAGVKSILDIPRTLEYLETQGVFVCTMSDDEDGNPRFPNFFERESEVESPAVVRGERGAADLLECHFNFGLDSGLLIAVPVPKSYENSDAAMVIAEAAAECAERNVRGKDVTPFILDRIKDKTGGSSVISNQALLLNNARVAAKIGCLLAESREGDSRRERLRAGRTQRVEVGKPEQNPVVVVGGAALDFLVKVKDDIVNDGRTHWSRMEQTVGGVGRNVAQCLKELGARPLFIAAVGSDAVGRRVRSDLNVRLPAAGDSVRLVRTSATTSFIIVLDRFGQHFFEAGDVECLSQLSPDHVRKFEESLRHAPLVFIDGNIPLETMDYVLSATKAAGVPVFFEPTTASLAHKPFTIKKHDCLTFASPNVAELFEMNVSLAAAEDQGSSLDKDIMERFSADPHFLEALPLATKLEILIPLVKPFVENGRMEALLVTMGHDGLLVARHGDPRTPFLPQRETDEMAAAEKRSMTLTHYPVDPLENIVSVSGAGDCLAAGFVAAMVASKPQDFCAAFGQLCARATLTGNTTVPTTIDVAGLMHRAEVVSKNFENVSY